MQNRYCRILFLQGDLRIEYFSHSIASSQINCLKYKALLYKLKPILYFMVNKTLKSLALAAMSAYSISDVRSATYDFTLNPNDAQILGATFSLGSAPQGRYNTFLNVRGFQSEAGFNTDSVNPWGNTLARSTHSVRVGDLGSVMFNGQESYVFKLDANETQFGRLENLTIFGLDIYTMPDAANINQIGQLNGGNLVYSLGNNNIVVRDTRLGNNDLTMYIPMANFSNAQDSDNLIFYFEAGLDNDTGSGFWSSAGGERWSHLQVPEPSTAALVGIGATGLYFTRRKRQSNK